MRGQLERADKHIAKYAEMKEQRLKEEDERHTLAKENLNKEFE